MVDFRLYLVNPVEYARANRLESGKMHQAENGNQKNLRRANAVPDSAQDGNSGIAKNILSS